MSEPVLQLQGVAKGYGEIQALKPITFALSAGEVLGLVGENGAGKSTLLKVLSGVHPHDVGRLLWQGREMRFGSPFAALQAGIATIHQELAYCSQLSVAENLLLGEPWPRRVWGGVDWKQLHALAAERLARFELPLSTTLLFHQLSPAQRQEVAIVRALAQKSRLLILDEPTASFTEPEVRRLFDRLQKLPAAGIAIIYVSHRLDEILHLTDRILVLRDGEAVASYPASEATVPRIVKDMVGRPLDQVYPRTRGAAGGSPVFSARSASSAGKFQDISFDLRAGEILGVAGLVGAGRSELARAVYGLAPCDQGRMELFGKPWLPQHPRQALAAELVYLPEERKRQGFVLEHSVSESISIGFTDLLCSWHGIDSTLESRQVAQAMQTCDVRAESPDQPVGTLSGGNQQKALLSRWLARDPQMIILDEPTRGVDVGAKAQIHGWMDHLAATGKAILLISSDLPELLGMSDRVLVLHQGRITAELGPGEMTQERVLLAASGLTAQSDSKTSPPPS